MSDGGSGEIISPEKSFFHRRVEEQVFFGVLGFVFGLELGVAAFEYGLACSLHHVQEVGEVMQAVQAEGEQFLAHVQVAQIRLAEGTAGMMFFTGCSGFSCLPEINFVGKNREEVVRIFASNPTKN